MQSSKTSLEAQQAEWEQKLTALIEKFEQIENEGADSSAAASEEDSSEGNEDSDSAEAESAEADTEASGEADGEGSNSGTTTYQAPSYDTPNQGY